MNWYRVAAEAVVLAHVGYVSFVVFGMVAIVAGLALGKKWARHLWFRTIHLAMIGIVALEAWLGLVCPLTTLEKNLRRLAGQQVANSAGFIQHWVHRVLFIDLPPWAFIAAYTVFGLLVLATFVFYPPVRKIRRQD